MEGEVSRSRVLRDTRRGFYGLLAVSLVLHLVLTPFAGLLGFLEAWLSRPELAADEPREQLREIPIELFEDDTPEPQAGNLPEDDPVTLIDQLVDLPVVEATPPPPAPAPKPPEKPTKAPEKAAPEADAGAPTQPTSPLVTAPSAAPTQPAASMAAPVVVQPPPSASTVEPVPAPSIAGTPSTAPSTAPVAPSATSDTTSPAPPAIDNPIALAGKGAKIIEKQTSVGLVLYMDRVRAHPFGKRIASLLPKLPQWDEFFGEGSVNPVDDFDRMFVLGPSFVDSSGLVIAIEYNTSGDKIRSAVNGLVKRRGSWVTSAKIPTALTFADRAERAILFPAPKVVVIVPPHLREQAQNQGVVGVPKAKGPEAMVASTVNPAKALRRFGIEVPASLQSAKIRVTPLSEGRVLLELEAIDESAAKAKETAELMTRQVNALVDVVSGLSSALGRFGFGGLAAAADLPKISLQADGKTVKGSQVLSQTQVAFVLDRIEREINRIAARRTAPAAAPAASTAPAKPSKPTGR